MKNKKNPSNLLSLWQKLIKTGVAVFFWLFIFIYLIISFLHLPMYKLRSHSSPLAL